MSRSALRVYRNQKKYIYVHEASGRGIDAFDLMTPLTCSPSLRLVLLLLVLYARVMATKRQIHDGRRGTKTL